MPLVDPSTGQEYATAPISNEADIDNAYAAASKAFKDWKRTTPSNRQKALLDFADDVERNAQALVEAEGRESVGRRWASHGHGAADNAPFGSPALARLRSGARRLRGRGAPRRRVPGVRHPRPDDPARHPAARDRHDGAARLRSITSAEFVGGSPPPA